MSSTTAASPPRGRNYIAGQWRPAGQRIIESHNPAHWDEIVGIFPAASAQEANEAVAAARQAYPA